MASAIDYKAVLDPRDGFTLGDFGITITNQLAQKVGLRVLEQTSEFLRLQCIIFLGNKQCLQKIEQLRKGSYEITWQQTEDQVFVPQIVREK